MKRASLEIACACLSSPFDLPTVQRMTTQIKVTLIGGPLNGEQRMVPPRPDHPSPTYAFEIEEDGEQWGLVYAYDDDDPTVMRYLSKERRVQ